jgi:hypothetical protein
MGSPLPPWHMWGSRQTISLDASLGAQKGPTKQLARISYGRPETWAFFFAADIVAGPVDGAPFELACRFEVLNGVGRGVWNTSDTSGSDSFARFSWLIPAGQNPLTLFSKSKWTASVQSPEMRDGDASSSLVVDRIVGQDIQVAAYLYPLNLLGQTGRYIVDVAAFLAPMSHVRPEWFEGKFPGDENQFTR